MPSTPVAARRRMTTPVVNNIPPLPQPPPEQTQKRPAPSVSSVSFPSSAWECVPRSSASHSRSRNRPRNKRKSAPPPLCRLCRSQAPLGNASREAPLRIPAPAIAFKTNGNGAPPPCVVPKLRLGMRPAKLRFAFLLPQPPSKQTATAPRPPVSSFPSSAWECVPRSSASHSCSRNRPRNKHSPRRKAGWPSHRNPGGILSHPLQRRREKMGESGGLNGVA